MQDTTKRYAYDSYRIVDTFEITNSQVILPLNNVFNEPEAPIFTTFPWERIALPDMASLSRSSKFTEFIGIRSLSIANVIEMIKGMISIYFIPIFFQNR